MDSLKDFIGRYICFGCEFCYVSNGRVLPAGGLIFQSKDITLYHKMDSFVKGVIVLTPKVHVPYLDNLSTDIQQEVMDYVEITKNFLINYGHANDVVVFKEEGNHAHLVILPKIERDWSESDIAILGNEDCLRRRNIPVSDSYQILLLTQALKNHFKKVTRQMIKYI